MESLAMIASFRVEVHTGHSTGGSMPLSQKNGMPTGERNSGAGDDCDMLCPRNTDNDSELDPLLEGSKKASVIRINSFLTNYLLHAKDTKCN